jgi:hypothetical protein
VYPVWVSGASGSLPAYVSSSKLYFNPSTGALTADKVFGAVWNDIADFIGVPEDGHDIQYGKVYIMNSHNKLVLSDSYCAINVVGIASDTYGFGVGINEDEKRIPIALAGIALAYIDRVYPVGTPLTCDKNGYLTEIKMEDKMKYPERIVATFYKTEEAEYWNTVAVNGRHWVKIK